MGAISKQDTHFRESQSAARREAIPVARPLELVLEALLRILQSRLVRRLLLFPQRVVVSPLDQKLGPRFQQWCQLRVRISVSNSNALVIPTIVPCFHVRQPFFRDRAQSLSGMLRRSHVCRRDVICRKIAADDPPTNRLWSSHTLDCP